MENIPHLRYLALCGTPKEKMTDVVILNIFFPTVLGLSTKIIEDGAEDGNSVKSYESTWNIVQFLRVIQSTFENYTACTNPSSSCKYEISRLGEYHKYQSLLLMLHV
jgi:hypothetical protein